MSCKLKSIVPVSVHKINDRAMCCRQHEGDGAPVDTRAVRRASLDRTEATEGIEKELIFWGVIRRQLPLQIESRHIEIDTQVNGTKRESQIN